MFDSRVQPHVGKRFLRGRAHHHRTASMVEDDRSIQVTILFYPIHFLVGSQFIMTWMN